MKIEYMSLWLVIYLVVKEPLWNTWNPMESEYLAQRNTYSIDDEDAGLALHGYSKIQCMHSV